MGNAPKKTIYHVPTKIFYTILGFLFLLTGIVGLWVGRQSTKYDKLNNAYENATAEFIKTNQFLLSTIDWTTREKRLTLYMRDIIVNEWKRVGAEPDYNKAFIKSEAIVKERNRYPHVDPFAMLAVQRVESSFLDSLTSVRHAKGSWQLVESTAKLLCGALGINYSNKHYWDPVMSTKLAGKYFDVLFSSYEDTLAMFADYNGGPRQAGNYLYQRESLDPETDKFIKDVKAFMDIYREGFAEYNPDLMTKEIENSEKKQ